MLSFLYPTGGLRIHILLANALVAKHLVEFVMQFRANSVWPNACHQSKCIRSLNNPLPSLLSSGYGMAHLEFGQDWLATPHPLKPFELAQGAIEIPLETRFGAEKAIELRGEKNAPLERF
jgi:hypothetical protein